MTTQEMELLNANFNLDELSNQLQSVIDSKDPMGYMENNLNWEIDNQIEPAIIPENNKMFNLYGTEAGFASASYAAWNPFRRFIDWFRRSKLIKTIRKALCTVVDKIKQLIDEEAELKKILGVAISAIAAAIGAGSINAAVLTIVVGMLATMILKGVEQVCAIA
jgi:hypothetical protein